MNVYSTIQVQAAAKADLIIENSGKTYLCYLQPSKLFAAILPTSQNAWRIECYDSSTANGVTTTKLTYPNGVKDFVFAPDNIADYTFSFRF